MTCDFVWCRASMVRTVEQRYAVKFCFKLGKSASEIFELITQAYGDDALSHSSVFERHKMFKKGRELFEERSNRCSGGESENIFGPHLTFSCFRK